MVADKAGDSYDMVVTGIQINRAWKSDEHWFGEYIGTYVGATLRWSYRCSKHMRRQELQQKQDVFYQELQNFKAAFNKSINDPNLVTGSKFQDASKYYHADGNYNFSHLIDWAEIQVGGSFRQYSLNSSGTIYTDFDGPIDYSEFGVYTQIQKNLI